MAVRERLLLENICDEIGTQRRVSRANWRRLRSIFGERFERAWKLVKEGRVKRYIFHPSRRVVWIAVGQSGEYLILPAAGYCACSDFFFRVVDGEEGVCYHLLAMKLADALKAYEEIDEEDEVYQLLMEEWRERAAID